MTDGEDPTSPSSKLRYDFVDPIRAAVMDEVDQRAPIGRTADASEEDEAPLTPNEYCDVPGPMWATLTERGLRFLKARGVARLCTDRSGAVMVEYAVLIGAVALASSAGLITVGVAVANNFAFVRGMLLCPIP